MCSVIRHCAHGGVENMHWGCRPHTVLRFAPYQNYTKRSATGISSPPYLLRELREDFSRLGVEIHWRSLHRFVRGAVIHADARDVTPKQPSTLSCGMQAAVFIYGFLE